MKFTGKNESFNLYIDRSEANTLKSAYGSRVVHEDDPIYVSRADDNQRGVAIHQDEDYGIGGIADVPLNSNFIVPGMPVDRTIQVVADIVENLLVYKEHVNKAEDEKRIDELVDQFASKTAAFIVANTVLEVPQNS